MDKWFLVRIKNSIKTMRDAGINDDNIGWIIYEIRAKAIQAEHNRMERVFSDNPPSFNITGFEIADMLKGFLEDDL